MKVIKLLSILFLLIIVSGCSATYNLEIVDNESFEEEIYLFAENDEDRNSFSSYNTPVLVDVNETGNLETNDKIAGLKYYDFTKENNNIRFFSKLNESEIRKSSAIFTCFDYFNFSNYEADKYLLSTSNGFTCFEKYPPLNYVIININLDNEVISSNATKVEGNTYTWVVKRDNASDFNISIKYKAKKENIEASDTKKIKDKDNFYVTTLLIFFIVLIIAYRIIKKKKYKN